MDKITEAFQSVLEWDRLLDWASDPWDRYQFTFLGGDTPQHLIEAGMRNLIDCLEKEHWTIPQALAFVKVKQAAIYENIQSVLTAKDVELEAELLDHLEVITYPR